MFRFKQFSVDQTGCAMKINTDGVLLGATATTNNPLSILDIGAGTGVIALMLAQRFAGAGIDAVEIDKGAATTATENFKNSPFVDRLKIFPIGFEAYFNQYPEKKYDLIVSNPPFYINSLQSPGEKLNLAKHAPKGFFELMVTEVSKRLKDGGSFWLILPVDTAGLVKAIAGQHDLHLQRIITIRSFSTDVPHREILSFGMQETPVIADELTIYDGHKVYNTKYQKLLKDFLTIF
ncbi:methyltransferase [Mucilaginibacter sp. CAU 1740]|uniref:tRNA1(Val) (adenine(37)-N6)-methyltransferase n=1 Tax=Mucilaginibacter sp. CAU 1740 TaxID=3140365 RepID=UPI00325C0935